MQYPFGRPYHTRGKWRFASFMRIAATLRFNRGVLSSLRKDARLPGGCKTRTRVWERMPPGARLRRKQKIRTFVPLNTALHYNRKGVKHWALI